MNPWKIPLFALALAGIVSGATVVRAEDTATPPAASAAAQKNLFLDEKQVGDLEKMSPDERKAFFKKRHEQFKGMSPEDRKAYREKRKEWFKSLPPEKQQAIKDRMKKMHEDYVKNMTPEEKKKFDERKAKFMEHRKHRHDGEGKTENGGKDKPTE